MLRVYINSFAQSFQFIESATGNAAQPFYTRQVADTLGDKFTFHCVKNSVFPKKTENVKVRVTDVAGRTLKTVFANVQSAGSLEIKFSMQDFSKGIYLVNVNLSTKVYMKKLIVDNRLRK